MRVTFKRTGARRYAVVVARAGSDVRTLDPAPGYDDHVPHDLVHYIVEAELGLKSGVYGRAALGGGTFLPTTNDGQTARERARTQRKRQRREQSLRRDDEARGHDMIESERLAALCDLAWRRHHGQHPDPARWSPAQPLSPEDTTRITRVVTRLTQLAPHWHALPIGGELTFVWPSVEVEK